MNEKKRKSCRSPVNCAGETLKIALSCGLRREGARVGLLHLNPARPQISPESIGCPQMSSWNGPGPLWGIVTREKEGGKQTPHTPRPSRFSPLGSGAGMVSPTHSLKSGYGSCRSVSMTLAPDEVTNRMMTEMASLRRHASTSSSDSGGQRKDKDRRAASSFGLQVSKEGNNTGRDQGKWLEQRGHQSRVRREVAMKTLRNSPWNEKEQYIRQKANYLGSQLFAVTAEVGRDLAAGNRWEEDSDFDDLRPSASEVERSDRERATGGDPFQSGSVGQLETSSVDTSATTVALISSLGEDNGAGSGQRNAGERANSESIIGDNTVVRSTETREAQTVTKQRHSLDDADMSEFLSR